MMNYLYYKSKKGNFGDDINPWLWPQLFNKISKNSETYFIGIGSILHNESDIIKDLKDHKKIIFGTGVRPSKIYSNFKIEGNLWDVKFFRGPLSANLLNNKYPYITDAAYAIRHLGNFDKYLNMKKKYNISLMPYFHSTNYVNWKLLCEQMGYHYISPLSENGVEHTISEIASSKYLITEAMHGAIISDILRVPWHRFIFSTPHTEGERISEFKWNDWTHSVNIRNSEVTFIPFEQNRFRYRVINKIPLDLVALNIMPLSKTKNMLIDRLSKVKIFNLSEEKVLNEIDEKINIKIKQVIEENT